MDRVVGAFALRSVLERRVGRMADGIRFFQNFSMETPTLVRINAQGEHVYKPIVLHLEMLSESTARLTYSKTKIDILSDLFLPLPIIWISCVTSTQFPTPLHILYLRFFSSKVLFSIFIVFFSNKISSLTSIFHSLFLSNSITTQSLQTSLFSQIDSSRLKSHKAKSIYSPQSDLVRTTECVRRRLETWRGGLLWRKGGRGGVRGGGNGNGNCRGGAGRRGETGKEKN